MHKQGQPSDHCATLHPPAPPQYHQRRVRVCVRARALKVMLMGDFNYIFPSFPLPFPSSSSSSSPAGAADMSREQTRGTLIKGLVLVLNSLLLERPAFISLAQQTTDTHRRLGVRTGLRSYTPIARGVCLCDLGPSYKGC